MTLSAFTRTNPRIVGLTGGIASGKSLACTMFSSLGVPTLCIDLVARSMHQDPSHPATRALATAVPQAMTADGALRRGSLRTLFARDETANTALKEIFRPYVQQAVRQWTDAQSALYVVWEAALLADLGLSVDRILVIEAPPELRTSRMLTRSPGWSRDDAEHLIAVQAATPLPFASPTDILMNTGTRDDLSQRVRAQHACYLARWS
ncbi:dephospho-CoA kinase [Massilia sp. Dwa41.01b]|uniref:dephospho-CoA kinase n=1 Tax=unclassified Massilia TaxID=2609279 RepID=UPI0015FF61AE|nr:MULTISPECIES: dephospho-CoA kinase [unclassified Massilia]QNA89817.1 dephospho-CoA kinase [Massilia sp. Dwa41.01b]QNB00711.1 dephospho-CoA kinase [Massilia sp. Se16.2.3]